MILDNRHMSSHLKCIEALRTVQRSILIVGLFVLSFASLDVSSTTVATRLRAVVLKFEDDSGQRGKIPPEISLENGYMRIKGPITFSQISTDSKYFDVCLAPVFERKSLWSQYKTAQDYCEKKVKWDSNASKQAKDFGGAYQLIILDKNAEALDLIFARMVDGFDTPDETAEELKREGFSDKTMYIESLLTNGSPTELEKFFVTFRWTGPYSRQVKLAYKTVLLVREESQTMPKRTYDKMLEELPAKYDSFCKKETKSKFPKIHDRWCEIAKRRILRGA